ERPRGDRALPLGQDGPLLSAIVAADDQPARVLPRERRPEPAPNMRVGDQTRHDIAGEGGAGAKRRPGSAGIGGPVEVAPGSAAEDMGGFEGIDGEDPHFRSPDRKTPPGCRIESAPAPQKRAAQKSDSDGTFPSRQTQRRPRGTASRLRRRSEV